MSDSEEKIEGALDDTNDIVEDDQIIENAEELQQEKEEKQFYITGNTATTQIFVQNLDTLSLGNGDTTKMTPNSSKVYDLTNLEECICFFEENKNRESLIIAIILCVFDKVPLEDLGYLESSLNKVFSSDEVTWEQSHMTNLALNSILGQIKGQIICGKNGKQWVSIENGSIQAISNIMTQFPRLKSIVIQWMIDIGRDGLRETSFDIYQLTTAFLRVIEVETKVATSNIFPMLYESSDNLGILGLLIYRMYTKINLKCEAKKQLEYCMRKESSWEWKVVCIVYSYFAEHDEDFLYDRQMQRIIKKKIMHFGTTDYIFIVFMMFQCEQFRTIISFVYNESYKKAVDRDEQERIAKSYVKLIRFGYYHINSNNFQLPLVGCDSLVQQENISLALCRVMDMYQLRKQLYTILDAYLTEISRYRITQKTVKSIAGFFYDLIKNNVDFQEDIGDFLNRCENTVADKVYQYIFKYN